MSMWCHATTLDGNCQFTIEIQTSRNQSSDNEDSLSFDSHKICDAVLIVKRVSESVCLSCLENITFI